MTVLDSLLKRVHPHPHPSSAALPDFISKPLSDASIFNAIHHSLTERENKRIKLSAPALNGSTEGGTGPTKFDMKVGQMDVHKRKNRYGDIIAYDATRVLSSSSSDAEYINATLLVEPSLHLSSSVSLPRNWWIAAQAPLSTTLHSFLSLLLSPISSPSHPTPLSPPTTIIQLTSLTENGRSKCCPYFPAQVGEKWVLEGERDLWVVLKSKEAKDGRRMSVLSLGWIEEGEQEEREVIHVEYLDWGDHGVPEDPSHLLSFISYINSLLSSPSTPTLIHCSAGVGRTGTYLTISSLLPLLSLSLPPPIEPLPSDEYPADALLGGGERDFVGMTVDGLREQRCTMVQTKSQLRWCYEALGVGWEELQREKKQ